MLLAVVGGYFIVESRGRIGKRAQQAAIWGLIFLGAVAISGAQLAYMLDGIDWRNPQRTWRPEVAG